MDTSTLVDDLTSNPDPLQRARAAEAALRTLADLTVEVAEIRRDAVVEAAQRTPVKAIAEHMRISPARVYALIGGLKDKRADVSP